MEKDRSDYEALFGEHYKPKPWTLGRLMLLIIILGAIFVSCGIAGCDFQAAQATHEAVRVADEATAESIQAATEKKEALAWMPINWTATVTQCDTKDGCRTRFYSPSKQGTEQARLAPTRTKDQSDPAKFGERK